VSAAVSICVRWGRREWGCLSRVCDAVRVCVAIGAGVVYIVTSVTITTTIKTTIP
jgi:hypothetical protein